MLFFLLVIGSIITMSCGGSKTTETPKPADSTLVAKDTTKAISADTVKMPKLKK